MVSSCGVSCSPISFCLHGAGNFFRKHLLRQVVLGAQPFNPLSQSQLCVHRLLYVCSANGFLPLTAFPSPLATRNQCNMICKTFCSALLLFFCCAVWFDKNRTQVASCWRQEGCVRTNALYGLDAHGRLFCCDEEWGASDWLAYASLRVDLSLAQ